MSQPKADAAPMTMDQFLGAFLDALKTRLPQVFLGREAETRAEVSREMRQLFEEHHDLVKDKPAWLHLNFASMVLASFKVLSPLMDDRKNLLNSLSESFREPAEGMVRQAARSSLDSAADPLIELESSTKSMLSWKFGTTFKVEQLVAADGNSFSNNVSRCFWHDFFTKEGIPELTRIFCDWDRLWFEEIHPDRHGVTFSRPTTLSTGSDMCRFEFRRTSSTKPER